MLAMKSPIYLPHSEIVNKGAKSWGTHVLREKLLQHFLSFTNMGIHRVDFMTPS